MDFIFKESTLDFITNVFYIGGALGGWLALLTVGSFVFINWVMTYREPKK